MIFKNSFLKIKENRLLFVLLFIVQLFYVVLFSYAAFVFYIKIMGHVNYLLERISTITPEQVAANAVENPLAIYSHYSSFVSSVI